jgi:hypothetical protein
MTNSAIDWANLVASFIAITPNALIHADGFRGCS